MLPLVIVLSVKILHLPLGEVETFLGCLQSDDIESAEFMSLTVNFKFTLSEYMGSACLAEISVDIRIVVRLVIAQLGC